MQLAMLSYAGQLSFALMAGHDSASDIDVLCRGIEEGIAERLAAGRKTAGRGTT